jgi:hypothetical protein
MMSNLHVEIDVYDSDRRCLTTGIGWYGDADLLQNRSTRR